MTSAEFHATDAQKKFLTYVVGKTLAGQAEEIKGYAVAIDVFGRRDDFDQATDPIVSIHANKLRRAIERYYLVEGQNDPIRIDIPKGAYVPTFLSRRAVWRMRLFPIRISLLRHLLTPPGRACASNPSPI